MLAVRVWELRWDDDIINDSTPAKINSPRDLSVTPNGLHVPIVKAHVVRAGNMLWTLLSKCHELDSQNALIVRAGDDVTNFIIYHLNVTNSIIWLIIQISRKRL